MSVGYEASSPVTLMYVVPNNEDTVRKMHNTNANESDRDAAVSPREQEVRPLGGARRAGLAL